jgi:hypothetical protein
MVPHFTTFEVCIEINCHRLAKSCMGGDGGRAAEVGWGVCAVALWRPPEEWVFDGTGWCFVAAATTWCHTSRPSRCVLKSIATGLQSLAWVGWWQGGGGGVGSVRCCTVATTGGMWVFDGTGWCFVAADPTTAATTWCHTSQPLRCVCVRMMAGCAAGRG